MAELPSLENAPEFGHCLPLDTSYAPSESTGPGKGCSVYILLLLHCCFTSTVNI